MAKHRRRGQAGKAWSGRGVAAPAPPPGPARPRRRLSRPGGAGGAMGPGWRAASAALVGGSVAIFGALRRAALALPQPAAVRSRPGRAWRWWNLLVSFVHSVLAGLWALFRYRGLRAGAWGTPWPGLRAPARARPWALPPGGKARGGGIGVPASPISMPCTGTQVTPHPSSPAASGTPRSCSPTSRTATASQGTCWSASPQVRGQAGRWLRPHHRAMPFQPHPAYQPGLSPRLKGRANLWASCFKHKHRAPRLPTPGPGRFPTLSQGRGVPDTWHTVTPPSPSSLLPLTAPGDDAQARPPQFFSLIPQATSSTTALTSSSTTSPARLGSTWCTTPW